MSGCILKVLVCSMAFSALAPFFGSAQNQDLMPEIAASTNLLVEIPAGLDEEAPVQRRSRVTALKRLEDDLAKALGFSKRSRGITGGEELRAMPRPVPQRARSKEDIERERDWIFLTPDELAKAPTAEELLKLKDLSPEERERKRMSAMERFFDSQNQRLPGVTPSKPTEEDIFGPRWLSGRNSQQDPKRKAEDELTAGVQKHEKNLRQMLGLDAVTADAPASPNRAVADLFGPGTFTSDSVKSSSRSFDNLYGAGPVTATINSGPVTSPSLGGGLGGYNPFSVPERRSPSAGSSSLSSYLSPGPSRSAFNSGSSSGSSYDSSFSRSMNLPDVNNQVLNAWNPDPRPKYPVTPERKPTESGSSQFTFPQRAF